MIRPSLLAIAWLSLASSVSSQDSASVRRLSNDGVARASALVDSVYLDRTKPAARIDGGDWASYMLARLGTGPIPDSLGIEVTVDTARIEVRGRLQDLPPEARALLGPLANVVDSTTVIEADVMLERTGPEVARFRLRGIVVNGFPFPEFLLGPMMTRVGKQYPALTASGRDLYVQIPRDGTIALATDAVLLSIVESASGRDKPTGGPARER